MIKAAKLTYDNGSVAVLLGTSLFRSYAISQEWLAQLELEACPV